ncbi:N-acetylmuramoyl-L-alanine amidase [Actinomycetes bacterium KLBMP 9797]
MTSPYQPAFQFSDWPDAPLNANLPPDPLSPNAVLNQVEAEFGHVATALTALDSGLRAAINALLAGHLPAAPELPVSPSAGDDAPSRAALLDGAGGLVVFWHSPRVNNINQVYAARLDLAHPERGFAAPVAVTSGTTANTEPTAVALPNGELIVAYTTTVAGNSHVVMKRAPLAGLASASPQNVATGAGGNSSPHAVLAGGRVVFFSYGSFPWSYRRYDHATGAFVDATPVAVSPVAWRSEDATLHAAASGGFVWMAYGGREVDDFLPFAQGRRLTAADGAVTGPVTAGWTDAAPSVLAVGDTAALVFHSDGSGLRAVPMTAARTGEPVLIPGTTGADHDPAAVRDADGTVYLCYTRVITASHRAVMLSRRSVAGVWSAPQRVTGHAAIAQRPHPVLVPGRAWCWSTRATAPAPSTCTPPGSSPPSEGRNPMARLLWLADVLRAAGLTVHEVSGWRTRGADSFGPVRGITCHATAGSRTSTDAGEIGVLLGGSSSAPPPIAQLYLSRTGHWHVVASGLCFHNKIGWGGPNEGYGNDALLGVEAQNDNRGEPWPAHQLDAYQRGVAALCRRLGLPAARVAAHREHQPGAKTDPHGIDMTSFRARVAALLSGEDDDMAHVDQDDWEALIWRVEALVTGRATVAGGPTKGAAVTPNVKLAALEHKLGALLTAVAGVDEATAATLRAQFDQIDAAVAAAAAAGIQRDTDLARRLAPALVSEIRDALAGLPAERVEAATERAVRRVFGSLDSLDTTQGEDS